MEHLLDVAGRLPGDGDDVGWLNTVGLCHDIGKATAFFQPHLYGESSPQDLRRHAELGALWLLEVFRTKPAHGNEASPLQSALGFLFVLRHHGRLGDLLDELIPHASTPERVRRQLEGMDVEGLQQFLAERIAVRPRPPTPDEGTFTELRVKVKLALNATHSDGEAMARFQAALRSFGMLIDADRDSAARLSADYFDAVARLTTNHIVSYRAAGEFGTTADPVVGAAREHVYQSASLHGLDWEVTSGRLWSLTAPTGSGKTLAAIAWAVARREARLQAGMPHSPIIYALPFTAIIDQTVRVLRDVWQPAEVDETMLSVHHHLAEPGDLAKRGEESLARTWVEGWRADVVCTTFVQIVSALFHGTCADARRLHRLAGSILILDEIQAFPAELWPVLRSALKSLSADSGTDILLVTATQPALFSKRDRIEIGPGDLPADAQHAFDRYDVRIDIGDAISLTALGKQIADELVTSGRKTCVVIVNTVREALDIYKCLQGAEQCCDYRLFHLSTNLRPRDRERILAEIRACTVPHVLVATQVVEAGVDLSFDLLFRALAPLDAVVQAAGRCNRHRVGVRGLVHLIDLEGNRGVAVYGQVHMAVARELLARSAATNGTVILREPQLRELVGQYFEELDSRVSRTRATKVLEAVRMLQFAALRGEGYDRDRNAKRVQLIEDQFDRLPHFIETDDSDSRLWTELNAAIDVGDLGIRRRRLRSLRSHIGQRLVEVPRRDAIGIEPDDRTGLVHVPLASSSVHYDVRTGWRRRT